MRACLIGEGMLELSHQDGGWRLGHGGDTLNTAIHLARLGLKVSYVTALGADPFSDDLRAAWTGEGLDPDALLTDPARVPGLYAIRTDDAGERSFTYWRGESAARGMFDLPAMGALLDRLEGVDLVATSLITLAILPPEGREALLDFCRRAGARGAVIAFDGNYRPRLWPDPALARAVRAEAAAVCDIGLPSLDDETALHGDPTAEAVAARWTAEGAREVVVKLGAAGCRLPDGAPSPPPAAVSAMDTSGAGDAFNAAYLAARLAGQDPAEAAMAGHRLAGWVVTRPGAIPPVDAAAPYAR